MGNAYLYRMPAGIPGVINRTTQATTEAGIIDTNYPPTSFGRFVKMVSGLIRTLASGDAATDVIGLIARPYPYQETTASQPLGTAVPRTTLPCDILKRGYMTVLFSGTTAAKGGQVYVRITADTGKLVGDIEEAADSAKCVAVVGCTFMGAADTDGNVEIAYNI